MNRKQRRQTPQTVRVYDPKDGTATPMPTREMAPFMMETNRPGIGSVMADAREMLPGITYFHPPIREPNFVALVSQIQRLLNEVFPMTWEEWEDGFRRDLDIKEEIRRWFNLSYTYHELTSSHDFSMEEKKDYFRVLLGCINATPKHALKVTELETISEDEARAAIDLFIRFAI